MFRPIPTDYYSCLTLSNVASYLKRKHIFILLYTATLNNLMNIYRMWVSMRTKEKKNNKKQNKIMYWMYFCSANVNLVRSKYIRVPVWTDLSLAGWLTGTDIHLYIMQQLQKILGKEGMWEWNSVSYCAEFPSFIERILSLVPKARRYVYTPMGGFRLVSNFQASKFAFFSVQIQPSPFKKKRTMKCLSSYPNDFCPHHRKLYTIFLLPSLPLPHHLDDIHHKYCYRCEFLAL